MSKSRQADEASAARFLPQHRARCKLRHGFDPEESYREFLLEIRVGGPSLYRLTAGLVGLTLEPKQGQRKYRCTPTKLSDRQREALALAACGLENAEIAEVLDVGIESVRSFVKSAYEKLGARNRTHGAVLLLVLDADAIADAAAAI